MTLVTQQLIVAIGSLLLMMLAIYGYIDSQRTINYYRRKQLPLADRPPRPTMRQKVLNFLLWLPPANW